MKIHDYMNDGANYQAQAVLAFLRPLSNIESSWSDELHRYTANVEIARWENCREQGYVVSLKTQDYSRQLNIAFFEHRNSDSICAVKWEQVTLNSPTIDTAVFGNIYKDKYDVSHKVGPGEASEMADWIAEQFTAFWESPTAAVQLQNK